LTFTLYTADDYDRTTRHVHIDPSAVVAVEDAERRPAFGGYYQVAVITLATRDKYIVEDGARRAAKQIAEAQQAATAAGRRRDHAADAGLRWRTGITPGMMHPGAGAAAIDLDGGASSAARR
jgi:hypothetical protein